MDRKKGGAEKGSLVHTDLAFYEREYLRLTSALAMAMEQSDLPDESVGAGILNVLQVRLRLNGLDSYNANQGCYQNNPFSQPHSRHSIIRSFIVLIPLVLFMTSSVHADGCVISTVKRKGMQGLSGDAH